MRNVTETYYNDYNYTQSYSGNYVENYTETFTEQVHGSPQKEPNLSYDPYLIKYNEDTNTFIYNDPWDKIESAQSTNESQSVPSTPDTNNTNSCNSDNCFHTSADSNPNSSHLSHQSNEVSFQMVIKGSWETTVNRYFMDLVVVDQVPFLSFPNSFDNLFQVESFLNI